jgi:serine/threonine-protein kinase HipA
MNNGYRCGPETRENLAYEVAPEFGLSAAEARTLTGRIAAVTAKWHEIASHLGAGRREIDFMSSAFEHDELKTALKHR